MNVLKSVADKHGLACLLHEKPFKGVNGSGKHVNWSLGNATQGNLLDPGDTPHENAQFLVFAGAVIRAVDKFSPLLRAARRLGGQRPPARRERGAPRRSSPSTSATSSTTCSSRSRRAARRPPSPAARSTSASTPSPVLPKDAGDRNRTSPFAFTGNRFEFRAVGSNQAIGFSLTALNTILADSLDYIAGKLEGAKDLNKGIQTVLKEVMDKHGKVIFTGTATPPSGIKKPRNAASQI